ncbi:MAG: DUF4476 domain-containing protein [Bdellovibrionales bacterium]
MRDSLGMWQKYFVFAFMALCLIGCDQSLDERVDNPKDRTQSKPQPDNRVNWSTVPSKFNPDLHHLTIRTKSVDRIDLDIFKFIDDVEVLTSADVPTDSALLRLFWVSLIPDMRPELKVEVKGRRLSVSGVGQPTCLIRIREGQIEALEGGCYVRLQILFPPKARVEAYNLGKLLTSRFIPLTFEELISGLAKAEASFRKFAWIREYLLSYTSNSKTPTMTTEQLGFVLDFFSDRRERLAVLDQLHRILTDRNNIPSFIDKKFHPSDRDEARAIVGL